MKEITQKVWVDKSEVQWRIVTLDGKKYVEEGGKFFAVASEKRTSRYVDADERWWDHSHDGNGWTEYGTEYAHSGEAVSSELQERLSYITDLRLALTNYGAEWVAALPAEQRRSFYDSVVAVHRSNYKLHTALVDGAWVATENSPEPQQDDGWETL